MESESDELPAVRTLGDSPQPMGHSEDQVYTFRFDLTDIECA